MTEHSYFHVIQKLNEMLLNNACLLKQKNNIWLVLFLTQIFRVYLYYSSVARILEDKINLYKGNYYLESVSSKYINLCTQITSTIKLLWMQIYKRCCNTYIPIKRTRLMKWVRYESTICDCFTFTQNMQCNNFFVLNKLLGRDSK